MSSTQGPQHLWLNFTTCTPWTSNCTHKCFSNPTPSFYIYFPLGAPWVSVSPPCTQNRASDLPTTFEAILYLLLHTPVFDSWCHSPVGFEIVIHLYFDVQPRDNMSFLDENRPTLYHYVYWWGDMLKLLDIQAANTWQIMSPMYPLIALIAAHALLFIDLHFTQCKSLASAVPRLYTMDTHLPESHWCIGNTLWQQTHNWQCSTT